jgi:hypothetical protein
MTDIWVWQIYEHAVETPSRPGPIDQVDVTGFEVEATDGHIGNADKATYEAGRGNLVVDTGFWIFGKKRMIPAGVVIRIDPENRTIVLGVTKDQVKDAPDFDEARREEEEYRREVGGHYERFRGDPIGPVAGTGRAPGELTGDPIGPVKGTG